MLASLMYYIITCTCKMLSSVNYEWCAMISCYNKRWLKYEEECWTRIIKQSQVICGVRDRLIPYCISTVTCELRARHHIVGKMPVKGWALGRKITTGDNRQWPPSVVSLFRLVQWDHNVVITTYTDQSIDRTLPSAGNN